MKETIALDILLMMKKEGVITAAPIDYILESETEDRLILDSLFGSVIIDDSFEESKITSPLESEIQVSFEDDSSTQDSLSSIETPRRNVVIDKGDGSYSFESEMALDVLIKISVESWLLDVVRDTVEEELGRSIEITDQDYTPVGYDMEKDTITIRVTFADSSIN